MRVVFMGTPQFAVPILEELVQAQYQIVAVYTQPDRPAGRGRSLISSAVKRAALNLEMPLMQPAGFKDREAVSQLADFAPDVIVVAAYGQILPQSVLDIPPHGCINVHPSLLPKFRGATPITAAILAGEEVTGVSIMLLDAGMDTGPVLAQKQVPIAAQDTTGSLAAKLSSVAAELLLQVLPQWTAGELTPQSQNEAKASYSSMLSKRDGEIDWQLPALDIWRRVRAFNPWPGCFTEWQGKQLKIIEAIPLPQEGNFEVGQVVALNREEAAFGVNTGDGVLGIVKLQLEGKKVMTSAEFLRGQRQLIGARLPSS